MASPVLCLWCGCFECFGKANWARLKFYMMCLFEGSMQFDRLAVGGLMHSDCMGIWLRIKLMGFGFRLIQASCWECVRGHEPGNVMCMSLVAEMYRRPPSRPKLWESHALLYLDSIHNWVLISLYIYIELFFHRLIVPSILSILPI